MALRALITGTSSGIGREIALKFLSQGITVTGLDIKRESISHPNYSHILCDIAGDSLPEPLSPYDILINNAGVQDSGRDIEINLKGTIRVTEKYAFHEGIKSVLIISSASGQTGSEFPEYAATKGGDTAYMKTVAVRISKYGATSMRLSPGGVLTELNARVINSPELWKRVMDETLLEKWASPEEIAEWAYFVCVVNRSMTAQDILIDNGEAAKANFGW